MSSILTNNGAMVALQTLKGINASMAKTQSEISTGKSVASAKDNAAVWAISKVMESDVKGFEGISDSLALGESTVAVGRNAAEGITDLLKEVKGKIVSAQEENVDRAKLQTDIEALTDQIKSVVGSAQFNGLNLVNGSSENPVSVLSSLDRSADGVKASSIDVATADMRSELVSGYTAVAETNMIASDGSTAVTQSLGDFLFADATGAGASGGTAISKDDLNAGAQAAGLLAGDTVSLQLEGKDVSYTIAEGDALANVISGLSAAATDAGISSAITIVAGGGGDDIEISSLATEQVTVKSDAVRGDMGKLSAIDVVSDEGASAALEAIEGMIQSSIDTAASFGSAEKRIEIQSDFVGKLTDSLKSGIGSMVDANMEETSARLQALQVQQQLGTQSLSIANQAPQALLSLFR
ncbi:MAG: flagellin [Rhodobacterales bacterium]|nr:MAG: flagellin [Rhodobacterales bacterium]